MVPSRRRARYGLFVASLLPLVLALPRSAAGEEPPPKLIQDFEDPLTVGKWPPDGSGVAAASADWSADGTHSLRIDSGLLATFDTGTAANWRGYSVLRLQAHNPSDRTVAVGLVLTDRLSGQYFDRHQEDFGVPPGDHTVELEIGEGLWRGQPSTPYRGSLKTPLDISQIVRVSFENAGPRSVYIDRLELTNLPKLETAGGFAFDFGTRTTPVMNQFVGVFDSTLYTPELGYGMAGGRPSSIPEPLPFPTRMLGDGLSLPAGGFRVDLAGGEYLGWIGFERGGFWENQAAAYSHAALKVNGVTVHEHEYSPTSRDFLFQDTEITDMAQLADKLFWPAHAIHTFRFHAAKGGNVFTLDVQGSSGLPLRVAGLILAPDIPQGRHFLQSHESLQRRGMAATFVGQDRGSRGIGREPPAGPLVCRILPPGAMVYPRDWPASGVSPAPARFYAVTGQTLTLHLGLYASKAMDVEASAKSAEGPAGADILSPRISYGVYMPMRPATPGVGGIAWLEVNHYRPAPRFALGPDLCRSVVAEYRIPKDAKPGEYASTITFSGGGEQLDVPVRIKVIGVRLAELPIPVGVFYNALPFGPDALGEAAWWRLQESLVQEQAEAGLTCVTGGPGLDYQITQAGGRSSVSGDAAVRYLKLACKYGLSKAVVHYGGFFPRLEFVHADPATMAQAFQAFEAANALPPNFFYAYDEPITDEEHQQVIGHLAPFTAAGLRTLGYTSPGMGRPDLWDRLVEATFAPCVSKHDEGVIQKLAGAGKHPWVYNNGMDRYALGLHLWRNMRIGVEGRLEWIGLFTQGFAFHNLDGREPSRCCFLIHRDLGALKTPMWFSAREGLLDARIRLSLEQAAPASDPALRLWTIDGYNKDQEKWNDAAMEKARLAMLKRLEELTER